MNLKDKDITLIDMSITYDALFSKYGETGKEIFTKLLLNLKNPPFILKEKELELALV